MRLLTLFGLVVGIYVCLAQVSPPTAAVTNCKDCQDWTQHWELQGKVNLSGVLPVYKYKSIRTGLTVVLAQADSPIVNGYFCLATEARTEDGLPHTLEHLVFLGR